MYTLYNILGNLEYKKKYRGCDLALNVIIILTEITRATYLGPFIREIIEIYFELIQYYLTLART